MAKDYYMLQDVRCPECGKNFCPSYRHVYHAMFGRTRKTVCSNKCMNAANARHDAEIKQEHRYVRKEKCDE